MPDEEVAEIFQARDLDQAIQRGVGVALLRGGSDNITIGGIQVVENRGESSALHSGGVAVLAGVDGLLVGLALGAALS